MSSNNLSEAVNVIKQASEEGVLIFIEDGKVKFKADKNKQLNQALLEQIRKYKEDIAIIIGGASAQGRKITNRSSSTQRMPLSYNQEGLWFIDQLEGSVQYHVPAVLRLTGDLDVAGLESSLRGIVNRHEVLRSVILEDEGQAYQQVLAADGWSLSRHDVSGLEGQALQSYIEGLIGRRFDLSSDHMLRCDLLQAAEGEYILVLVLHHIASDGWSTGIIISELVELYDAYLAGRAAVLPELGVQYADYALWQRSYLSGSVLEEKLSYWQGQLTGAETLNLPTDYVRPAVQSTRGALLSFELGSDLSAGLQSLSQQHGVTLFMTLLSAFKVLLSRYSGQSDICVGSPVAGRMQQEVEGLVGFFINTLALRSDLSGDPSFTELLGRVRETTLSAYEHQDVPFEKVVERVVKHRDMSRSPLFGVLFSYHNTPKSTKLELGDLRLTQEPVTQITSQFDFIVNMEMRSEHIRGSIEYCTDLYTSETIDRLFGHYRRLLESVLISPEIAVSELEMLSIAEREQLVAGFNQTGRDYDVSRTVLDLFAGQVKENGSSAALVFEGKTMSYDELDAASNRLGHYLRGLGVGPESLVGICLERGMDMVVAILGILKSGGAYVPIDPDYPADRISYMLADSGASYVVSSAGLSERLPATCQVIELDGADLESIGASSSEAVASGVVSTNLAYVIYTSGSTGRPKGVMVEHSNLLSYLDNDKTTYIDSGQGDASGSYFHLSYTFDASLTSLFCCLIHGKRLVIAPRGSLDVFSEPEFISNAPYEFLKVTPAHLHLMEEVFSVRPQTCSRIVVGGEALHTSQVRFLESSGVEIINEYGPTEATVGSSVYRFHAGSVPAGSVSIGTPISNTRIYILNSSGGLCPVGVSGELYIGGSGVARGYLNRADLTAERFIASPFASGERLYRTGDLGRWLADGNIEYVGRMDDQVKVRGYRIELGEIESVLQTAPGVSQGVVVARADGSGHKRLLGYYVGDGALRDQVHTHLSSQLPDYMVPGVLIALDALPLTPNGKVDRKGLPDPDFEGLVSTGYVAPVTQTEVVLAGIWADLLGLDRVGIHDNFFELGGHSLMAIRLVSAIRKELDSELSILDVFDCPSIELLALKLAGISAPSPIGILHQQARPDRIPLSYSQERLWFIDQLEGSVQYHVPAVLRLTGDLDVAGLESSLRGIVNRHEVLRSVILEDEGQAYQQVLAADGWSLSRHDVSGLEGQGLQSYIEGLIGRRFDLSSDHMLRCDLLQAAEGEYILVLVLHHIASDGWSTGIIISELVELYDAYLAGRAAVLPELGVQYADYALWQRSYLSGPVLEEKLSYWQGQLTGAETLNLPTDYVRPAVQSTRGALLSFELGSDLSAGLQSLSQQHGVTLFMTLLSAFKVLLSRYSGQSDICVGSPVAGRMQQEVEGLVGFFINTLALRSDLSGDPSFTELLGRVRETTLSAYEHQDVPFEKVVERVVKHRDMSRSPLFSVMFVFQNTPDSAALDLGGQISFSPVDFEHNKSTFDISLSITETVEGIKAHIEYCTDLYTEQTIDRLFGHYRRLLESVLASPGQPVSRLEMLSGAEHEQLLTGFNQTGRDYDLSRTVLDLFAGQVKENGSSVALVFEGQTMSYGELDEASNRLGHYLRGLGVGPESLVGICLERGMDMVVAILGILKSGGAYVPIDPDYPIDRISYMLTDSGASYVVSSESLSDRLAGLVQVIQVDGMERELIGASSSETVASGVVSTNLAYVIYTSGSTGRPKGVMVEHRNLVNLFYSQIDLLDLRKGICILQFASISFDACSHEIFCALLIGGKLVLTTKEVLLSETLFVDLLKNQQIDLAVLPPAYQEVLKSNVTGISTILSVGEALNSRTGKYLLENGVRLLNGYGPTENTVCATIALRPITENGIVSIGRPVANVRIYILNSSGDLCPVGVAGELYIGGSGVARGYLNRADLTAERFIASPFVAGDRLYRTGDLGRWLADGNIEYVGRMDDQVKVRGYRIELGEIESVLQTAPGVSQGVVVARADGSGHKRLIGYYVGDGALRDQVHTHLSSQLPDYMVPGVLIALDALPLTPNGKVDRKGLPDPDFEGLVSTGYVAPVTQTEQVLAGIWADLLGLDRVGIHDNFFELGGDSIITIQVVSRAKRQGYYLRPRDLFSSQTVSKLSELVSSSGDQSETGEQGLLSGASGLLPIQDWYFSDVWEGVSHFNQAVLLTLSRQVSFEVVSLCMQRLVYQHDALRFVYHKEASGVFGQHYGADVSSGLLSYHDLSLTSVSDLSQALSAHASGLQGSLDIYTGDLVRAGYFEMPSGESDNRLLIVVHHLAVDGVSWRVLLEDLQTLIDQHQSGQLLDLGSKGYSYRQWHQWLSSYGASGRALGQLPYWERSVRGSGRLVTDGSYVGSVLLSQTGSVRSELGVTDTDLLLHHCSRAYQTEINDILLCALRESVGSILEGGELLVGLEGHGREVLDSGADLSRTVGWFTSLYPVLLRGDWAWGDAGSSLKSIKEQLRQVPDKGLGYGVLKYMNGSEPLAGADPWEVVFNYLGQFDNVVGRSGHFGGTPSGEDAGHSIAGSYRIRYKLSVTAVIREQRLVLDWNYSTLHFDRSTIERLSGLYISSLQGLIGHCVQQGTAVRTPSDYGLGGQISYQELDKYFSTRVADGRLRGQVVEDIYRLSGLQEGMLFHGLYEHGHSSYIEQVSCRLRGVDKDIFIRSWESVIRRHSILRSGFEPGFFGIPVQCVYSDVVLPLYEADYRGLDASAQSAAIGAYAEQDRRRGFSFDEVPLLRLSLLQTGHMEYRMVWTYHHLLLDGWSTPLLVEELLEVYEQLSSGASGGDIMIDEYGDYIRYMDSKDAGSSQSYWREYLSGLETGSLLPFIGPSAVRTKGVGEYKELSLRLDASESAQVESYGQKHRLTVNTIMQGVWAYLLHSYTGQSDVVYGVTVSGRPDDLAGVERRIGMYINTLPLHGHIEPSMGIVEWLTGIQASQLASREHQYSSLSDIQQWAGIKGDLFDSLFVFENYPVSKTLSETSWSVAFEDIQASEHTNYPLDITIVADKDGILIKFNYNAGLLASGYVSAMLGHFHRALIQIAGSGQQAKISEISILGFAEREQLLAGFNQTGRDYDVSQTVLDLFAGQVKENGSSAALVFEGKTMSYGELDAASNRLGHYLRGLGVGPESLVGICLERGMDMVVAILGILKSGGAYVPIDPDYPADRISYMLADSGASYVVSSAGLSERLPATCQVIELDGADLESIGACSSETVINGVSSANLAYVIYTSGSTGRPKGVMVEHKNLANLVLWHVQEYRVSKASRATSMAGVGFDAFGWELFPYLSSGASVLLVNNEDRLSLGKLGDLFCQEGITHSFVATAMLWDLVRELSTRSTSLEYLLTGGDRLAGANPGRLGYKLVNNYGPTENTVVASNYILEPESGSYSSPSIGAPIGNTRIYILNSIGGLCPVGVAGELYIGGSGVARGYLNRADLTAERFIASPFVAGDRLYRTGDLGRWLPDGNIEYVGRMDDQVKVRGYRIELGEIESVLQTAPGVSQGVVVARADGSGHKRLIGYYVGDGALRDQVHAHLSSQLPDYMVPGVLIALDALPLTPNGKVDRKGLPDPDFEGLVSTGYVAPVTQTEQVLAGIWADLLGLDRVGIHDNFFELGGHSLSATRLVSSVRRQLGTELLIRDLFVHPTVHGLAGHLASGLERSVLPSVVQADRPDRIPLSYSQERLWFIDQLEGSVQYHVPAVLRLTGDLDVAGLESSLRGIVNRHEVLRSVILEDEGQAYQQVLAADGWSLSRHDVSGLEGQGLQSYIEGLIGRRFDLSSDHMLRCDLLQAAEGEYILVLVLHHIASDGWSTGIIISELVELYDAYLAGRAAVLPELGVQYADYALWQRSYLSGPMLEEKLSYWQGQLTGAETLNLPTDYVRPAVQSTRGALLSFELGSDLSAGLQSLSQQHGVTLFMTLLSAFKVLLSRYSGQSDICVGSPVAGRMQQEVEGLVGFFINTLALRSDLSGDPSFTELLGRVRETTLSAYEHQDVPFEKVVERVVKHRDMSRSPLFGVLFSLENTPRDQSLPVAKINLISENVNYTTTQYDIQFNLLETSGGVKVGIGYNTDLYASETIDRLFDHYRRLLESVLISPEIAVSELEMLSIAEREQLVAGFNQTGRDYDVSRTVLDLFAGQVKENGSSAALVFEGKTMSYDELDAASNRLGHYLRGLGVGPESLVGICLERGMDMVVAILGILKSGGAYVPIDPDYPADRISYMLADSGASYVVSSAGLSERLPATCQVIELDGADLESIGASSSEAVASGVVSTNLAYVIYTSGSTGRPKGVMVEHSNLLSYLDNDKTTYIDSGQGDASGSYFHLSYTFDASLTSLFCCLIHGKRLVIAPRGSLDVFSEPEFISNAPYEFLKVTPAHLHLMEEVFSVRPQTCSRIVVGGEALHTSQVRFLESSGVEIINEYGPTEATVGSSVYRFHAGSVPAGSVSIGTPISNTRIYILNSSGGLCPVGVSGELYIGGSGVARGYLNRADLTAERFIASPFASGERLYRTGDLGRWLADGNIEYVGRMDDQVKVRGYRIELGEIESVLQTAPGVSQGVVVARADGSGHKRLLGYYVGDGALRDQVHTHLSSQLPDYMVPGVLIALDALPLTPNGKVDRKGLPDPDFEGLVSTGYVAPVTQTEVVLAGIWADLLGLDRVGIHDNFFELGGHSLMAIRLVSAIRKELDSELSILDVFDCPSIELLALKLAGISAPSPIGILHQQARPDRIPLSYSQERLWFIDQLEGSVQYHVPAVLRLTGDLDVAGLESSLRGIVNRHEVLRSVILEDEGQAYQQVLAADGWSLSRHDVSGLEGQGLQSYIEGLIGRRFDLSSDHMLRCDLLQAAEGEYILVLVLHHIASDGWSTGIIISELVELYDAYLAGRAAVLPELGVQYADYALWQRSYLSGPVLEEKLSYWQGQLTGAETLNLPTDYVRPAVQSTRGALLSFELGSDLSAGLQSLSQQHGVTLFMTLLSAFKVLLSRYSGQSDICVGSPVAGRMQQEVEGLVGFFINTLALRSDLSGDPSFTELLGRVRETTLSAYEHQDVPFEKVVERVVKHRDMSRSPLFGVIFSLQNVEDVTNDRFKELHSTPFEVNHVTSQFDMIFNCSHSEGQIFVKIEYSTDLFRSQSIENLFESYQQLLYSLISNPLRKISQLQILSQKAALQLDGFNESFYHYEKEKQLVDLFTDQVDRNPSGVALTYQDQRLTYQQLDERSSQVARMLLSFGVKSAANIGLLSGRGPEMIVGILGILKSGCAYVPLNTEFPSERLRYMLSDSQVEIVLTANLSATDSYELSDFTFVGIDRSLPYSSERIQTLPQISARLNVMYTSGTTGRPKGIVISQQNVLKLIEEPGEIQVLPSDRVLQWSNYGFDGSSYEIFSALMKGACLVLIEEDAVADVFKLADHVIEKQVSVMFLTTALFNGFVDARLEAFGGVRKILFGGEAVSSNHVIKAFNSLGPGKLIHVYGPTETTVFASFYPVDQISEQENIPIGKPLANTRIRILDPYFKQVPVGAIGEIFISGDGVSIGYIGDVHQSDSRFLNQLGDRLYRTGDLGRWLPDGNIEYVGRIDDQVKVRGYRIELGEIESVLQTAPGISQGVVVARADGSGHKRLIGYYVGQGVTRDQVHGHLSSQLPDYMVPGVLIALDSLPLTPNGKVDRKGLPDPDFEGLVSTGYVAPVTQTEKVLAGIWADLLGLDRVGIHDNFFELGGDSIITIQVVARSRQAGIHLQVSDLFSSQTVSKLSELVSSSGDQSEAGEQDLLSGASGLLPIQEWYFSDVWEGVSHFNQAVLLTLSRQVSFEVVSLCMQRLVHQHDALRFIYQKDASGVFTQHYGGEVSSGLLSYHDLSGLGGVGLSEVLSQHASGLQGSLDIYTGDLVRAGYFEMPSGESDNRLLIVVHHLAVDGVSWRVLLEDLQTLIDQHQSGQLLDLGSKGYSYRQWHQWLSSYGASGRALGQLPYWERSVRGSGRLVTDSSYVGRVLLSQTGSVRSELGVTDTDLLLHHCSRAYQTEINDILLCALRESVGSILEGGDLLVGLEGHGREVLDSGADLSRTVGWFTSLYPVLLRGDWAWGDAGSSLKSIKEQLRQVPDKGLGYGVLKYMNGSEPLAGADPWEVVFNYLGQFDNVVGRSGHFGGTPSGEDAGHSIAGSYRIRYKLSVTAVIREQRLVLDWNYSTLHFDRSTIERLSGVYISSLQGLISHCVQQVSAVRTPSDYGLGAEISYEELDKFLSQDTSDFENIMDF